MKRKIFTFLSVLIISTFCFSLTAFAASSYVAPLGFQGEHTGSTRSYTGTDMNWSGTTYTQHQTSVMPTTFTVALFRKNWIGSSKIGDKKLERSGTHDVTWSNVGSGNYYFYYMKSRDGANVKSDAITMKMS